MTRRRRSLSERVVAAFERQWRLLTDPKARRRSEGSKRAWVTRKRNTEDLRVAEDLARNETARIFKSDPTP